MKFHASFCHPESEDTDITPIKGGPEIYCKVSSLKILKIEYSKNNYLYHVQAHWLVTQFLVLSTLVSQGCMKFSLFYGSLYIPGWHFDNITPTDFVGTLTVFVKRPS